MFPNEKIPIVLVRAQDFLGGNAQESLRTVGVDEESQRRPPRTLSGAVKFPTSGGNVNRPEPTPNTGKGGTA